MSTRSQRRKHDVPAESRRRFLGSEGFPDTLFDTGVPMAKPRFYSSRCLVTGASSGIGRSLAVELARQGARLIVTGRSAARLDATVDLCRAAGAVPDSIHPVIADLTSTADRRRLLEFAHDHFRALDLAINSAGVGAYGRFQSHDEPVTRQVFEINLFALMETTRGVFPLLRAGNRPALINIGSIVSRRGMPGRSEYSASKFAVAGFTESIRAEWSRDGIHVMLVNPGFTATDFERHLVVDTAVYKVSDRRTMSPEAVARATLSALHRRRKEITLTPGGNLLLWVNRLFPRFVDWGLSRWTSRLYADAEALRLCESSISSSAPASSVTIEPPVVAGRAQS